MKRIRLTLSQRTALGVDLGSKVWINFGGRLDRAIVKCATVATVRSQNEHGLAFVPHRGDVPISHVLTDAAIVGAFAGLLPEGHGSRASRLTIDPTACTWCYWLEAGSDSTVIAGRTWAEVVEAAHNVSTCNTRHAGDEILVDTP